MKTKKFIRYLLIEISYNFVLTSCMKTKIIRIGNSRGIMLSKHFINQYELENEVEIVPKKEGLLIKPVSTTPRADWEQQFEASIGNGESPDNELLEGFGNAFDEKNWKW